MLRILSGCLAVFPSRLRIFRLSPASVLTLMLCGAAGAADAEPLPGGAGSLWDRVVALGRSWFADPSSREVTFGVLIAVGAFILLVLIFRLTHRALESAYAKLESWRGTKITPLRIQSYEVVSADRIAELLKILAKAVRVATLFVVIYVTLPVVLSFFPWSREWVAYLLPYLTAPIYALVGGFINYLPNLFAIIAISIATRYVVRFNRALFTEVEKETISFPGFHHDWAQPTSKLLSFIIIVFAVVLISPYLPGFGSPAFQGVSIFLGVLLSLGSTAAIANIIAGTALIYMRAFQVGDRVEIAGTIGDVVEKTLLVTRLRTVKNVEVTIPNALVLGCQMINFSARAGAEGLILHSAITIGYDAPWRQVHDLLIAAGKAAPHVKNDPPPYVLQTSLNDYSITYELNVYTDAPAKSLEIYSTLHGNIQDRFNEAGIEIMSPAYTALRDGNQATLPADYLPKTQEPKGFRFFPQSADPKPRP